VYANTGTTDKAQLKKRAKERAYAHRCSVASRESELPFVVVLALTPDLAPEFALLMTKITLGQLMPEGINMYRELRCGGIKRRKAALIAALAQCGASEDLVKRILSMGQKNSSRVAKFVASFFTV
jgi:hypothetical protein